MKTTVEEDELKRRLQAAHRALCRAGEDGLSTASSPLLPNDSPEATRRLLGEMAGLLAAWIGEIEEGGLRGLLHFAPFQLELVAQEALHGAEVAGAEPLAPEFILVDVAEHEHQPAGDGVRPDQAGHR